VSDIKVDNLSKALRIFITVLVYGIYIGMVFFAIEGNYSFLFTFDYWFTTSSTTMLALFLRWLYSDSGLEKELLNNDKIHGKEEVKSELIDTVLKNNLVDVVKVEIDIANKASKLRAYETKCDKKINFYREKAWWKINRKRRLEYWRRKRSEINDDDFNIGTVRVEHYKYDIDEMLSSFYKNPKGKSGKRRSKNQKVLNSTKANLITFLSIATLKGIEYTLTDFVKEDLIILFGQVIVFTLNIYNGIALGKAFVKEDYSSNLSDDIVFMKTVLKNNKGVI